MARFYQTTPIYYVNDAPHIGHAYTTVNADAFARWHRLLGDDVWFLTGTDEHGRKVAEAAAERGMSPREWADLTSRRFRDAWVELDVAPDDFIRTTEPRHHEVVQRFLGEIKDRGYIQLGTFEGLYCVACEDYYTDEELVGGNCPVHDRPVELMKEENYFFQLSRFQDRLLSWYEKCPTAILPESRRNEAAGFVRGGLKDISITRVSIDWGVRVPWDPDHVFYVWYDALVNYLTAIGYGTDLQRFSTWWPGVHHLIAKDILRFHCVWWPAMCMAAGIDPPHQVLVHGWLLVGGEKMSKTRLNNIAPGELVKEFGVDAVRYHLLRDTPLGADGDFSYEGMISRYNADLANNLGNLLQRVAAVVHSKCAGIGPAAPQPSAREAAEPASHASVEGLAAAATGGVAAAVSAWSRYAPHLALEATWALIHEANSLLESAEPWKASPGPEVDEVMGAALEALRIVAILAYPAMPRAAGVVWERIGMAGSPGDCRLPDDAAWGGYPGGLLVTKGSPLFPRKVATP